MFVTLSLCLQALLNSDLSPCAYLQTYWYGCRGHEVTFNPSVVSLSCVSLKVLIQELKTVFHPVCLQWETCPRDALPLPQHFSPKMPQLRPLIPVFLCAKLAQLFYGLSEFQQILSQSRLSSGWELSPEVLSSVTEPSSMARLEESVLQKLFQILSSLTCHWDVSSQLNSHPISMLKKTEDWLYETHF